ncbi:MAG: ProQ/FinO family protein [Flavobacteriales bacterium]|nr:ProQ/FinO family protein [Flavobacteriales bacterium]
MTSTQDRNLRAPCSKPLQERFAVFRDFSPLAIGIDKQLLMRLPDLDRRSLRTALRMHTNSLRYLKTIEKATHRIDLDGNSADEIAETHRGHAAEVLRERFRKDAERRKMQREAEATARRRSEKLGQLLDKFSKDR